MKFKPYITIFILILLLSACKPANVGIGVDTSEIPDGEVENQQPSQDQQDLKKQEKALVPEDKPEPEAYLPKPETENLPPENIADLPAQEAAAEKPDFFDNDVGFASQAPFAVWDEFHEETCEEAAMIMAVRHFAKKDLNAHIMEQELMNLDKWQKTNGYQVDLTAQEVKQNLDDYFNFDSELIYEVTVDRIKKELLSGKLIIVPAAGRQLGNPYFTPPGPIYHMLVVRGYDDATSEFITNDPGTKRGEAYRYKYNRLLEAIHDWNHGLAEDGMTDSEIDMGAKVIIAVGLQ